MLPLPEVTKNLLIINVLMFLAQLSFPAVTENLALYTPFLSSNFQPFQFVSYMFLHSPVMIGHIFFNMLGLYMFGRDLEYSMGSKKFLMLYLGAGLGAGLLHSGVMYWEIMHNFPPEAYSYVANRMPTLGASGAIFGLLAGFGMLYPNRMIMLLIPPIPMKAKYFVLIYGAMELYLGVSGTQTSVAHFAHLGGALVGFLMIVFWRSRGERF